MLLYRVSEKQISPGSKALLQLELPTNNTEKLGISDAATVPVKRHLVWGEPDSEEKLEDPPLEEGKEKEGDEDSNTNNQHG